MRVIYKWSFGVIFVAVLFLFPHLSHAKDKSLLLLGAYKQGVSDRMFSSIMSDLQDVLSDGEFEIPDAEEVDDTLDDDLKDSIEDSDCISLDCLLKAGGAMGSDFVLGVSVVKEDDTGFVNAVLVDVIDESIVRAGRGYVSPPKKDALTAELVKIAQAVLDDSLDDDSSYEPDEESLFEPATVSSEDDVDDEDIDSTKSKKRTYQPDSEDSEKIAASHRASNDDEDEDEEDNFVEEEPPSVPTFFTYAKWSALGVTVATAGVAVFTGIMAKQKQDTYNDTFKKYHDFDMQAKADADNYALATNVLIGVGSALAATTITFFILDFLDVGRDTDSNELSLSPSFGSNFVGGSVQVRF